jgi:uncharacterized membrane protein
VAERIVLLERHEPRLMINLRGEVRRRLSTDVLIHTAAAQLTIVFTEAALALDGLGYLMNLARLAEAGCWALAGAVGFATITALCGAVMRRRYRSRRPAARAFLRAHLWLGLLFYALLMSVMVWRVAIRAGDEPVVSALYLCALLAVSLVMIVQVYLGGEATYAFATEHEPIPLAPQASAATASRRAQPLAGMARERSR